MNRPLALPESDPMADHPPRGQEPDAPTEGEAVADPITRCLRLVYSEVAAEPIPDELMALLNQLDDRDPGASDG